MTPPPESRGKRGRPLGPIADGVGSAHRAWLEPLRSRLLDSGMTVSELAQQAGWAKSKVSELLRGTGLYPRWEITYALIHLLHLPTWPMRRLWSAAALEAHKKQEWIDGCIERVAISTGPTEPPIGHQAFVQLNRDPYVAYARVFLRGHGEAELAVEETFAVLWLRWDQDVLRSPDVQRFCWQVLRRGVARRAPRVAGRPQLIPSAFDTLALNCADDMTAQFRQLEESIGLFHALSRLADLQMDVVILKHLRGMDDDAVADVLGVPVASVTSADRHARRSLARALLPAPSPEGTS